MIIRHKLIQLHPRNLSNIDLFNILNLLSCSLVIGDNIFGLPLLNNHFLYLSFIYSFSLIYLIVLPAGPNDLLSASTTKNVRLEVIFLDCERLYEKIIKCF